MNIDEAFPSKWLASEDFPQPQQLHMSHVVMEEMGQGAEKENKPILFFQGMRKGMVLNKTNKKVIKDRYDKDTEAWAGQPLWVFSMMVESFGKMQLGIRVAIEQPQVMQPGPQTDAYQEMQQQQPPQQPAPLNNPPTPGADYQPPFVDPNQQPGVPQLNPDGSPYQGNT